MSDSNNIRMSFAEWLYRMAVADVPYQARSLAVYATVFKIASDGELARLSGMDTKGVADKTYNKWRALLCSRGWVIVKQVKVGRTRTTEVYPAINDTPVTFTDITSRSPDKIRAKSAVEVTDMPRNSYGGSSVTITDDRKSYGEKSVEVTDEDQQDAPAPTPAHAGDNTTRATNESPTEIVISKPSPNGEGEAKFTPAPAALQRSSPHMNGVGFVISEAHNLVIPAEIVSRWRTRFAAIPDLEAKMEKLASFILKGGIMHPGWTSPDGWMAGCLSDDNQRAINEARIADAKIANAQRSQPVKTFRR
jgi:hypothetical protein